MPECPFKSIYRLLACQCGPRSCISSWFGHSRDPSTVNVIFIAGL